MEETGKTEKTRLRRIVVQSRKTFTPSQLDEMSRGVMQLLERHPLFVASHTVLLFHSLPDEVSTHDLISRYTSEKQIILPTVVGSELQLHRFDGTYTTGAFGISEADGPVLTDLSTIDLAVIPGVAFDPSGNRLGRGKGYYDRLLPHLSCPLIGVCFPFQLVDHIPVEPHDMKMTEVITCLASPR